MRIAVRPHERGHLDPLTANLPHQVGEDAEGGHGLDLLGGKGRPCRQGEDAKVIARAERLNSCITLSRRSASGGQPHVQVRHEGCQAKAHPHAPTSRVAATHWPSGPAGRATKAASPMMSVSGLLRTRSGLHGLARHPRSSRRMLVSMRLHPAHARDTAGRSVGLVTRSRRLTAAARPGSRHRSHKPRGDQPDRATEFH